MLGICLLCHQEDWTWIKGRKIIWSKIYVSGRLLEQQKRSSLLFANCAFRSKFSTVCSFALPNEYKIQIEYVVQCIVALPLCSVRYSEETEDDVSEFPLFDLRQILSLAVCGCVRTRTTPSASSCIGMWRVSSCPRLVYEKFERCFSIWWTLFKLEIYT